MPLLLTTLLLFLGLFAGSASAQARMPAGQPVPIRVVGDKDGLPRPGAEVYLRNAHPDKLDGLSFLIAEDRALREFSQGLRVTMDPEGRATLRPKKTRYFYELMVAEPFFRVGFPKQVDGVCEIRVGNNEPVGVLVLDAKGVPMEGVPVAVHVAGRDVAVARSDRHGRAVLGLSPELKARAVICPAGWVGPRDVFPTVAKPLAGRRSVTLKMPPHGAIRLRRVRAGMLEPGPVTAKQFVCRETQGFFSPPILASARKAHGVFYPYVALGIQLESYPQFGSRAWLRCAGPTKEGEVRDVDVELGAQLTLRCLGSDGTNWSKSLTLRVLTDGEERRVYAQQRQDGRLLIEVGSALLGTKLIRVHLDAEGYSASLACDQALPLGVVDLGRVRLVATKPQLSGRVLDPSGQPVAGARVIVSPVSGFKGSYARRTDEKGYFESAGPVLRDQRGEPRQLYAMAMGKSGKMNSGFVLSQAGKVTLTLAPNPTPKRRPIRMKGVLVVRLVGTHDPRAASRLLQLNGSTGVGRFPKIRNPPGGGTEFKFYDLFPGTYRLLALAPDNLMFVAIDGLVVPEVGQCKDARLDGFDYRRDRRKAVLQVVDEESVPIAGARLSTPGATRFTDGGGKVTLYYGGTAKTVGRIQSDGKRTLRCSNWTDGQIFRLEKSAKLKIRVVGLPADVPRTHLEVWVRDPENRFRGPRRMLQAGDLVTMPLPARGKYRLDLYVTHLTRKGSRSRSVQVGADLVPIGGNEDLELRMVLKEAAVRRLRAMLKKPR